LGAVEKNFRAKMAQHPWKNWPVRLCDLKNGNKNPACLKSVKQSGLGLIFQQENWRVKKSG